MWAVAVAVAVAVATGDWVTAANAATTVAGWVNRTQAIRRVRPDLR